MKIKYSKSRIHFQDLIISLFLFEISRLTGIIKFASLTFKSFIRNTTLACIRHDADDVHKMLFVYNFTKIYFKEGIEVKREERILDETNLIECIQYEMNVNIENDLKPRNLPL